jgi:putative transcriptional regulator
MAILNRIRQLRVESDDMSQAHLAKQVGISRQTLNAIERGQRIPSLEVAHRIADALNCRMDDVFHYETELPVDDDNDSILTVTVRIDDELEWWKSDDVSRVTTRA